MFTLFTSQCVHSVVSTLYSPIVSSLRYQPTLEVQPASSFRSPTIVLSNQPPTHRCCPQCLILETSLRFHHPSIVSEFRDQPQVPPIQPQDLRSIRRIGSSQSLTLGVNLVSRPQNSPLGSPLEDQQCVQCPPNSVSTLTIRRVQSVQNPLTLSLGQKIFRIVLTLNV